MLKGSIDILNDACFLYPKYVYISQVLYFI